MKLKFIFSNNKYSNSLFVLILFVMVCSCTRWHQVYLKYIIPEDYEGMILIAWDQDHGEKKTMEGNYEVYKIPANGFLRSQVKARSLSPIDEKFYSYNKEGVLNRLEMIDPGAYVDTVNITKKNQFYRVGLTSGGHNGKSNLIFFITKDKNSKFMNAAYREKYIQDHDHILNDK